MGTRHLIAVQLDGEYKIAQYGQWDGYPAGQGKTVLNFLRSADLDVFKEKVRNCTWATDEQFEDQWVAAGAPRGAESVPMSIADKFEQLFPENSRNTGAKILDIVYRADKPLALRNNIDFAQDGLFCEYAYVIDLDANTLEVYTGFHKEPVLEGRFAGPMESGHDKSYGPIQIRGTWSLDALPTVEDLKVAANESEEAGDAT